MAKTFGTGTDPKGLVNRGVEGSGAAQIFKPSQAVQDFVSRQARGEQQKAAQKKAEAKAKVERQKDLDKKFQDLLKIDIKGWTEPDNQRLLAQYGDIEKQAAELKAKGINPFDDNDLTMKIAKFQLDMGALQDQKKLFELANTKAYSLATNKLITEDQFTDYEKNIKDWMGLSFEERMIPENLVKLDAPKVEPTYDYDKEVAKNVKNIAPSTKPTLNKALGVIIHTTEVSPEKIEQGFNMFKTTPVYKQKKTELIDGGIFDTEDEADEFLKNDYKIKFGKKTNYKGAGKGGLSIGFGGGVANSYKAEYRNISPNSINIQDYGLTPSEIIMPKDRPKYLRSVSLLSSDKKSPVPLAFSTNIRYKDPDTGKNKDITSSTPIIPKQLIEYKAVNGTKYLFLFNIKGVGDAAAVIDDTNKEDFQDYFLDEDETIETFLEKGEKSSKETQNPAPSSKPSSAPSKATITTKTGKTLTVPK